MTGGLHQIRLGGYSDSMSQMGSFLHFQVSGLSHVDCCQIKVKPAVYPVSITAIGFRNPASHWTEREICSKQDSVWIDYYIIPLIPMEEWPILLSWGNSLIFFFRNQENLINQCAVITLDNYPRQRKANEINWLIITRELYLLYWEKNLITR